MLSPGTQVRAKPAVLLAAALALATVARGEGAFVGPGSGATLSAGSTVQVVWSAPCAEPEGEGETELVLSLDGGLTFPVRISSEMAACAKSFRWQVPALETAHARLALRAGTGEGSESERLEFVSEEFSIEVGGADDAQDLIQGAREWWTPQAVSGAGAEDLPSESMAGGTTERLVAPDSCTEICNPNPQGVPAPAVSASRLTKSTPLSVSNLPRPFRGRGARPTPLRL